MTFFMAIFFSFIFMFIEISRVPRLISRYLSITPLFFLFIMLAFNRTSFDYSAYQMMFNGQNNEQIEFGYVFLIETLKNFGKDHDTIIFIVGILFLFTIMKMLKTSSNVNLVIFLYCCFPLVSDMNQTRNLLMYLIVTLSLVFVESKKPIRYYLGILLAFSIHNLALVYLPFYYFCKKNRKQYIKLIWTLFILFLVTAPLIIKFFTWLFPEKMGFYLVESTESDFGFIITISYLVIDIFTVWWVDKKISHKLSPEESKKMEVLYRFVWFSLLVLPFTVYVFEIKRVQRNALLVKYIYCSLAMKYLTTKQKLFTILLLLISVTMSILVLWYSQQLILFDFLDENEIKYYLDRYFFY